METFMRYILLAFFTLVAMFLGMQHLKAQEQTKKFFAQEVGEWEVKGTLHSDGITLCSVSTHLDTAGNSVFSYDITMRKGTEVKAAFIFVKKTWNLNEYPNRNGDFGEGVLTFKTTENKVEGMITNYMTLGPRILLVPHADPKIFPLIVNSLNALSFTPDTGKDGVVVKLNTNFQEAMEPLRECLIASTRVEYFRK